MLFPYENIADPVERTRKLVFAYQHVLWPAFFFLKNEKERNDAAQDLFTMPFRPSQEWHNFNVVNARIKGFANAKNFSNNDFDIYVSPPKKGHIHTTKTSYLKRLAKGEEPSYHNLVLKYDNSDSLLSYLKETDHNEDDFLLLTLASASMHPNAFKIFLETRFSTPPKTFYEFSEEHDMTVEYVRAMSGQHTRRIKRVIDAYFPHLAIHRSLKPIQRQVSFAKAAQLRPNEDLMNLPWFLSLEDIYLTARDLHDQEILKTEEFMAVATTHFYQAAEKLSLEEVGRIIGCHNPKSVQTYLMRGKQKISEALRGSELENHPALRTRLYKPRGFVNPARDLFDIDYDLVDRFDMKGMRLFHISECLFTPRSHFLCVKYFLEDFTVPRDKEQLISDLNTTPKGLRSSAREILAILKAAAEIEDPELLEHACFDPKRFGQFLQRGTDPYAGLRGLPIQPSEPEHPSRA